MENQKELNMENLLMEFSDEDKEAKVKVRKKKQKFNSVRYSTKF